MSSLYDNIWFESNCLSKFTRNTGIYEYMYDIFDENVFGQFVVISDHVPVWEEFETERDDD